MNRRKETSESGLGAAKNAISGVGQHAHGEIVDIHIDLDGVGHGVRHADEAGLGGHGGAQQGEQGKDEAAHGG